MKKLCLCLVISLSLLPTATMAVSTTANQAVVTRLKSKGDAEINRRLTSLDTLTNLINSATKLSASDKSSLASQVSDETSGLHTLKTKLDSDTDITTTRTDIQAIFSDYRVYALILPKVRILVADDHIAVTSVRLSDLVTKLNDKITAKASSMSTASLEGQLAQMQTDIANANNLYTSIHDATINLQPSDYNTDHTILIGKRDQLNQAATDLRDALADAKSIITSLSS